MQPADGLVGAARVEFAPVERREAGARAGAHGTPVERQADGVGARERHERGGERLVAAAEAHDGVGVVGLVHRLDAVRLWLSMWLSMSMLMLMLMLIVVC